MLLATLRFVSLTAVVLLAWAAFSAGHSAVAGQDRGRAQDTGTKIKELQKERLDAVRVMVKQDEARLRSGQALPDEVLAANKMLAEAELDVCESDKDRIAVLEKLLVRARDTEKLAGGFAKTGQGRESTALRARAERLRFEIALERAKAKAAAKPAENKRRQDLRDQAALAEKQAAIKQAAVRVTEAQKAKAQAHLDTIKAQVAQANTAESLAEMQYQHFTELLKAKAIEEGVLNEQRAKLETAKALKVATELLVAEAQSAVTIEQARILLARLEFEEAELRANQLKARLPSP